MTVKVALCVTYINVGLYRAYLIVRDTLQLVHVFVGNDNNVMSRQLEKLMFVLIKRPSTIAGNTVSI